MSLDISHYPLLAQANTPDELRQLPQERLTDLCDELRQYLLRSVSRSSGHLASGLGVVELDKADERRAFGESLPAGLRLLGERRCA